MESNLKLEKINKKLEDLYNDLLRATVPGSKECAISIALLEKIRKEIMVENNIKPLLIDLYSLIQFEINNEDKKEYGFGLIKQLMEELKK